MLADESAVQGGVRRARRELSKHRSQVPGAGFTQAAHALPIAVSAHGSVWPWIAVQQVATLVELESTAFVENLLEHRPPTLDTRLRTRERQAHPVGDLLLG
jgi:hypothetical protein